VTSQEIELNNPDKHVEAGGEHGKKAQEKTID